MAFWRHFAQKEQILSETEKSKESLIAPGLVIEGKIEGIGYVRIAGRFKGEINAKGD